MSYRARSTNERQNPGYRAIKRAGADLKCRAENRENVVPADGLEGGRLFNRDAYTRGGA